MNVDSNVVSVPKDSTEDPCDRDAAHRESIARLYREHNQALSGDIRYASAHYVTRIADSFVQYGALAYSRVEDKSVGNLNATLSLADDRFWITGYVRNVTDERHKTWVPGIGTSVDSACAAGVVSSVNLKDPRTYGVILSANF